MRTLPYKQRLRYTTGASIVVHLLLLSLAGIQPPREAEAIALKSKPVVLNLQPERANRLVDVGAISDETPVDSELISSHNTKAMSETEGVGDESKPAVDRIDDFEDLGNPGSLSEQQQTRSPSAATPPLPESTETPAEPEAVDERVERPNESPSVTADSIAALDLPTPSAEAWETREPTPQPEQETPTQPEQPMQLAQAEAPAAVPVQDLRATRGRESGGAEMGGLSSFEAREHELGAYMLEIRNHVEREWRLALQLRYQGSTRASAMLECSIRPDGTLEFVHIVDSGRSLAYATMCKAAVERASKHFRPFPFDVPPIYRNKNLEVRWRFTYM